MSNAHQPQDIICSCGDHLNLVQDETLGPGNWTATCLGCGIIYLITFEGLFDEAEKEVPE